MIIIFNVFLLLNFIATLFSLFAFVFYLLRKYTFYFFFVVVEEHIYFNTGASISITFCLYIVRINSRNSSLLLDRSLLIGYGITNEPNKEDNGRDNRTERGIIFIFLLNSFLSLVSGSLCWRLDVV